MRKLLGLCLVVATLSSCGRPETIKKKIDGKACVTQKAIEMLNRDYNQNLRSHDIGICRAY